MKTPWWFRLYTLHTLKFFAKVTACQFVLYYILDSLGGTFAQMAGLVILLAPLCYFISHVSSHFRTNIEFHKMSIPFPELKRAFFLDIAVKQIVFAVLFLVNLYIAIRISGGMKLAGEFMILTPSQLLYYVPMYFIGTASVMTFYKESKYLFYQKHRLVIVNLGLFAITFAFVGLLFIGLTEIGYTVPMIAAFGVSAITTGVLLFRSKAIFHQFRPVGRIRDAALFTTYGTAICLAFYLLAVFTGRNDVLSTEYSDNQRASSLTFSGPFAPPIDKETFVAIERVLSPEDYPLLYKKTDFPVASLGLEYFLDNDPQCKRLKSVLTYTKPEPTFLAALYDHFDNNPEYWKEKWGPLTFKAFAYSQWPAKTLPEKYEVAKVSTLSKIEEAKVQRAKKREIASKKRSR
jgi:hypothetical protein